MTRVRTALVVGIASFFLFPALAGATLPKTATKAIVTGKSIGGLGLGGDQKSVEKAWGKYPGECEQICSYAAPSGGSIAEVRLETSDFVHYKAFEVSIRTEVETVGAKDVANCDTPLAKYETSKGIHLCSKLGALKKAYPSLKKFSSSQYTLQGPGKAVTMFSFTEDGNLFSIAIASKLPESE
jgi:hypothetical protein